MSRKIQILVIIPVLAIGILGYYFVEDNWSFLDALYMTIITVSNIGYGEVKPLSTNGRLFTVFFIIIIGLSTAEILASQFAKSFIEKNFKAIIEENKMKTEFYFL